MHWNDRIQAAFDLVYHDGITQKAAAAQLGISARTVRNWARLDEWKRRYAELCEGWDRAFRIKYTLYNRGELKGLEESLDAIIAGGEAYLEAFKKRWYAKITSAYRS